MPDEIRRATAADADAISKIKAAVWLGDAVDSERIAHVIANENHATCVAVYNGVVVGFVDGFPTIAGDGLRRWELDLLAVHPNFRGQGIGAQLIAACSEAGRAAGGKLARALIKVDNSQSQRAFARSGYETDATRLALYVSSIKITAEVDEEATPPRGLHLIPVDTLNYRGVWLEGELSAAGFAYAARLSQKQNRQLAGAVIPLAQNESIEAALRAGYALAGCYQWWVLKFTGW